MEKFGRSQPATRVEDVRLLTGHGRYVDDIVPEGAYYAAFLRSNVAHGRIVALDLGAARAAPGVKAVYGIADIEAMGIDIGLTTDPATNRDGSKGATPLRPVLARDRVRFVGEPVACVVAETQAEAKDALELIGLEIEDLPAKVDLAPGGETLHEAAPDNVAFDWAQGDEAAVEAALKASARVVEAVVDDNRIIVAAMEGRACFAEMIEGGRLHLCFGGQGVWGAKRTIAGMFGVDADQVKITQPDVGGGFGMKAGVYPEYPVVLAAARALNHPVRWFADRTESALSDNGGRAVIATCTLGFDADNRITAYRVEALSDLGAYNSDYAQHIQSDLWAKVLTGTYDVQTTFHHVKGIFTNTVCVDAYRGAGRPEAIYALERMMDYAARELGVDPWELRRRNFIAKAKFPYRSATGELYDVGDFERVLDRSAKQADLAGFAARRAESAKRGRLRGLGLCFYIESILGNPSEDATVEFLEDGSANLYVGTQSNGQGHETAFATFLSDQTGIPVEKINFVQGDSDRIPKGGGTGGSRSATTQTNAMLVTVEALVEGFSRLLAGEHGVAPGDVSFDDERFRIKGTNETPTMLDAAALARARGRSDLLKVTRTGRLPGRSYPNGAHVAEVEVDPETGQVRVLAYSVTDDFGNMINPRLVEGQVHGGVVQGLGQALSERVVYDADGQLLTATFMDYGMPRAGDVPMIVFTTEPTPSTANVLGMKGCGEAGTVGSMAAVANACMDALATAGVTRADMPFTPHRVWAMLTDAKRAAA
jgi:carbon-monoxide dehydrogenase large subunit